MRSGAKSWGGIATIVVVMIWLLGFDHYRTGPGHACPSWCARAEPVAVAEPVELLMAVAEPAA